jgi:hypothetical protein
LRGAPPLCYGGGGLWQKKKSRLPPNGIIRLHRLICTADQPPQRFLQILPSIIQMSESTSIHRLIFVSKDDHSDVSNKRVSWIDRRPERYSRLSRWAGRDNKFQFWRPRRREWYCIAAAILSFERFHAANVQDEMWWLTEYDVRLLFSKFLIL